MSTLTETVRIYRIPKTGMDFHSQEIQRQITHDLKIDSGWIKNIKVFEIQYEHSMGFSQSELVNFSHKVLCDPVQNDVAFNLSDLDRLGYSFFISVGKHKGVTDDEAITTKQALCEFLNIAHLENKIQVRTKEIYLFENCLEDAAASEILTALLANPLIHDSHYSSRLADMPVERSTLHTFQPTTQFIDLTKAVSHERHLGLSEAEIQAILEHYENSEFQQIRSIRGLPNKPSDCEIELLAQTWSEHCKHKEFNATIRYHDTETGKSKTIHSLFSTYVKKATQNIKEKLEKQGHDWLVKVFNDNAGIVKVDRDHYFVWKVETHNSPSVLDPYGGAITGVLGCNRDVLGTGIGGAKLLFNTNVLCFGPPDYDKPLLSGQKHPRQILSGVVKGIMDGGNKSGVPTVNGSIHFDDRYSGKPLVFCGTGGIMPANIKGRATETKPVHTGDYVVMAGGRIGKDGIHGATLSSAGMDSNTPGSMVQIGSPLTQKKLSDFLEEACSRGLVKTCTDNGAGGLASSIGEISSISGGAIIDLAKAPLKYEGLHPWEILLSESQERMTLVIDPKRFPALADLANAYQVELSHLGEFTNTGLLEILYQDQPVALLPLKFLHDGVPVQNLEAVWEKPNILCSDIPPIYGTEQYNSLTLQLLSAYNICSRESVIRQYDHEVKANTIVKPLMGPYGCAPQDAAVVRLHYDSYAALIVSNGILPRLGDIDAYQMSAGSFDEAVRQVIAVGGELPDLSKNRSYFWSVNDNFCLPNCVFNPQTNPDGRYKLGQLVRMCEALFDYSTFFLIPMTSGKDSMKNDFTDGKQKISIPPTLLYSCVSQVDDFRTVTTAHFKQSSDLIYVLGNTYDEMAASELFHLLKLSSDKVPIVRKEEAKDCYQFVANARKLGLLSSCHDISDGGLAIALIESAFGGGFGIDVHLPLSPHLSPLVWLFSESPSRFIVSVKAENKKAFEKLTGINYHYLGKVTDSQNITIRADRKLLVNLTINECIAAWKKYDL